MSVQNLSDDVVALHALAVMYAWDMCDADQSPASAATDPRIKTLGLDVLAIITGSDDLVGSGPGGLRQNQLRAGGPADRKRYGYVARDAQGQLFAAIRGTDGSEEWFDDFVFVAESRVPRFAGRVEGGFADIYTSMQLWTLGFANEPQGLVEGLQALAGGAGNVRVLGHSLGSALGTLLTYELAKALGPARVSALLFAAPRVGDHDFVTEFANRATDYLVVNYEHDLVPRVPPFDITHMDLYRALPNVRMITDETAQASINPDKACCHHLICYIAMLSPAVYLEAMASANCTADDKQCAACVSGAPQPPAAPGMVLSVLTIS